MFLFDPSRFQIRTRLDHRDGSMYGDIYDTTINGFYYGNYNDSPIFDCNIYLVKLSFATIMNDDWEQYNNELIEYFDIGTA